MRTKEFQRISIDQRPDKDEKYTVIVRGKEYKSMCKELEADLEKEEYDNKIDVFAGTIGVIGSMVSGREEEATGVYSPFGQHNKYRYSSEVAVKEVLEEALIPSKSNKILVYAGEKGVYDFNTEIQIGGDLKDSFKKLREETYVLKEECRVLKGRWFYKLGVKLNLL